MKYRVASLAAALALAHGASAQPPIGAYTQPTVNPHPTISPYLNLNRGGGNAAVNYYGIVRPQIENQQAIQNLQQQFQTTQNQIQTQTQAGAAPTEQMAPTGHAMGGYLNYSHYFPIYSRGAGGNTAPTKR